MWGSFTSDLTCTSSLQSSLMEQLPEGDRVDPLYFYPFRTGYKHSQEGITSCFSSCLHPTKQLSSTEDRLVSTENNGVLMRALLPETAGSCTLALAVLLENMEFHILVCRLHRFPCRANPCSYHHLLPSRYCMFVGLKSELRSLSCFPQASEFH